MMTQSRRRSHDSEFRSELVARVRQEIQAGVYETPEKLEIALARLFAELETAS